MRRTYQFWDTSEAIRKKITNTGGINMSALIRNAALFLVVSLALSGCVGFII